MKSNVKSEKISFKEYINEYIKPGFKQFAETFATLGDILLGNSNEATLTQAEIEAQNIWKENPISAKRIENLEASQTIPEDGKKEQTKHRKQKKIEELKADAQGKVNIERTERKQSQINKTTERSNQVKKIQDKQKNIEKEIGE